MSAQVSDNTDLPRCSLIIPTLNGGRKFSELFVALKKQTFQPDEVLVVDSGSTDETVAIARENGARIIRIQPDEFDHGGTRTMAAKEASGDILVYMTQDAVPASSVSLEKLINALDDLQVAAAYGRQIPNHDATIFAKHLRLFNYSKVSATRCWEDRLEFGFKTVFISNSFAAYSRTLLERVGYFQDGLLFGEDTFAVARLLRNGNCVAYVAEAGVFHSHNYTVFEDFKRYFDIGVFHTDHGIFMQNFGTPHGEGKKYVKSELLQLVRERKFFRIPESFLRNGMKLLAYSLGKKYSCLPRRLTVFCSMNKGWWN